MKGKAISVGLSLLILIAAIGFGCRQQEAGKKIVLYYMTYETMPAQVATHQAIVDAFNKSQDQITVKLMADGSSQKIMVSIAGGVAPDVFMWFNANIYDLARRGALLEMTPYIKASEIDFEDYFPGMFRLVQFGMGEDIYGFPMSWGAGAIAYNKDLFDQAGVPYPAEGMTWYDFARTARKLTVAKDGRVVQYGTTLPADHDILLGFGAKRFDDDLTRCVLDSPEAKKAFQFLVDLQDKYKAIPRVAALSRAEQWRTAMQMFMTGRVAMYLASSFQLQALSEIRDFRWDVAPIPRYPGKKRLSAPGINTLAIYSRTKYPQEAWEFIKFACGPEGLKFLGKNCIPAHKATAEKYFLTPPPDSIEIIIDQFEGETLMAESYTSWGDQYLETVYRPELDKMLMGLQSVEQTIANMTAEGNKLLEQEKGK